MRQESATPPFTEVVTQLRDLVGAKLVAYLASLQDTVLVRQWAEGIGPMPSEQAQARLRLAHQVAALISHSETPTATATWLQGECPQLGDRVPARLLRQGALEEVQGPLLDAARAFVSV